MKAKKLETAACGLDYLFEQITYFCSIFCFPFYSLFQSNFLLFFLWFPVPFYVFLLSTHKVVRLISH